MDSKFLKAEEFGVRLEIVRGCRFGSRIPSISIRKKLIAFAPPSNPLKHLRNRKREVRVFMRPMSISAFPTSL